MRTPSQGNWQVEIYVCRVTEFIGTIQYSSMSVQADINVFKVKAPVTQAEQGEKFGKSSSEKGMSGVLGPSWHTVTTARGMITPLSYP